MDLTDLSAFLVVGKKKRAAINQWACFESSQACSKKPPPVHKVGGARVLLFTPQKSHTCWMRLCKQGQEELAFNIQGPECYIAEAVHT